MNDKFEVYTYTQEYKNKRYSNLKTGDGVWINVAHLCSRTNGSPTYCKIHNDEDWDKDTDCSYITYDLVNDKEEICCSSAILYPECYCEVVEKTDIYVVLQCCVDDDYNQFKLTKEELFVAATKYDGWEWEITF